jgi:uncharacterized protein with ParB-like and HNH nuclease domain
MKSNLFLIRGYGMNNPMDSSPVRFGDMFFNGKTYKIPLFQRDYSWREENWEDLWFDIINIIETGASHYMGALIFKTVNNEDELLIIDGQQRLATIIIIVVAGIKLIEDLVEKKINTKDNEERIKILSSKFIGEKDATSLFYKSKLLLNKKDNPFFQEYILKRKKPLNILKLHYSQKLLYKAFEYYYTKMKNELSNKKGEEISDFLENIIAKKLVFIQITVADDLSAYTVFETLNARGIELAPTDLLKNYFFSIVSATDLSIIEEKWDKIISIVRFEKFPLFLRYYLNSYRPLVRKERLFKEVKKEIKSAEDVIGLLEELENTAYFFSALKNPYDDFWNEFPEKSKIIECLEALNLFKVTQQIPLLFSIYKSKREILAKILQIIEVIAFRYNIIGKLNPNEMEQIYNRIAIMVFEKKLKSPKSIFNKLKNIYVKDDEFVSKFEYISINSNRNKKLIKYILIKIENTISKNFYDYNDSSITIEHILPENPSNEWFDMFIPEEIKNHVYRIGNMTLLESDKNREAGNKGYKKKTEIYKDSKFKITKNLNYEEWGMSSISKRQRKLSEEAKNIWRIDY